MSSNTPTKWACRLCEAHPFIPTSTYEKVRTHVTASHTAPSRAFGGATIRQYTFDGRNGGRFTRAIPTHRQLPQAPRPGGFGYPRGVGGSAGAGHRLGRVGSSRLAGARKKQAGLPVDCRRHATCHEPNARCLSLATNAGDLAHLATIPGKAMVRPLGYVLVPLLFRAGCSNCSFHFLDLFWRRQRGG